MHEDSPRVAMLLTLEEAQSLLEILLATEPSEATDRLLCHVAEVQRLLTRHKFDGATPRSGPPCATSRTV